jgi:hypothetical protein
MKLFSLGIIILSISIKCVFAVPTLSLESITGVVEIRKAGQDAWIMGRIGAQLQSNDVVRCGNTSRAVLHFEDGQQIFVNANSQILINLYDNPQRTVRSRHFTLFYGAAFFLVKSILPKTVNDIKVFTPTAIVATRGTSFSVEVPESRTTSCVKVTNGTILIRNIIRPIATFVSAGLQTSVAIGSDPQTPQVLLDKEIRSLKNWVGEPVIAKEISLNDAPPEVTHKKPDTTATKPKIDVIILPLANRSTYKGSWNISRKTSAMLATIFTSSIANIKISAIDSAFVDPLVAGTHYDTRYVVMGSMENLDIVQEAKVSVSATEYIETVSGFVKVHLQIIDVGQKKMIHEADYVGSQSNDSDTLQLWSSIKNLPYDLNSPQFTKSALGRALTQALTDAGRDIIIYTSKSN